MPLRRFGAAGIGIAITLVLVSLAVAAGQRTSDRSVSFATLPPGWLPGIPRDVRAEARIVRNVGGQRLAVAPTRNGNFCQAFSEGHAGCRVRGDPIIGATLIGDSRHGLRRVSGNLVTTVPHQLFIVYGDGDSERVPVVWVSRPIGAGFFSVMVRPGERASRLELRRGPRVIERSSLTLRRFVKAS
jgi:hypothetical protein